MYRRINQGASGYFLREEGTTSALGGGFMLGQKDRAGAARLQQWREGQ